MAVLAKWRFITRDSGAPCVIITGISPMLKWFAESWAVAMPSKHPNLHGSDGDQGRSG